MGLKNKVTILIGLNDVGIAVGKGLLDEGVILIAADKNKNNIDKIIEYGKSIKNEENTVGIVCDATKEEEIKSLVEQIIKKFGRIDILITNFWFSKLMPFVDVTEKLWNEILEANLKAAFRCVRAIIPHMKKSKRGKIIHILSLSGYTGAENEVPLSTASASLMGFTKAVAKEVGKNKINVNAVALPRINSESFYEIYSKEEIQKLKELIPLDSLCKPEDVVGPVKFLASKKSNHLTGEIMIVSGGQYMQ
ncbi:MAG: SDR family NAD(P)-dependent oxidoreductase [Candidatus Helarchaeota archaeon]